MRENLLVTPGHHTAGRSPRHSSQAERMRASHGRSDDRGEGRCGEPEEPESWMAETREAARQRKRRGGGSTVATDVAGVGGALATELQQSVAADKHNRCIPLREIRTARLRHGVLNSRLGVELNRWNAAEAAVPQERPSVRDPPRGLGGNASARTSRCGESIALLVRLIDGSTRLFKPCAGPCFAAAFARA